MRCSKCEQSTPALTDDGLCEQCQAQSEERRFQILDLAREQCQLEGAVEIDESAEVSEGEVNGCYVQAWVWVDFSDTDFDKEREEKNE